MADVSIDETARIERVRYDTQTGGFAGNPASGYAWHWVNGTGTYSGVFIENDQGDIFGPFVDYDEGCRVYNSSNVTITGSVNQQIPFDTERWDTNNIHSTTSNTSRLTCRTAGKYLIVGNVHWYADGSGTGTRIVSIRLNGSSFIGRERYEPGNELHTMIVTTIWNLAVGDYVELNVYQTSGGNLDILNDADFSPEFMVQRIGY